MVLPTTALGEGTTASAGCLRCKRLDLSLPAPICGMSGGQAGWGILSQLVTTSVQQV